MPPRRCSSNASSCGQAVDAIGKDAPAHVQGFVVLPRPLSIDGGSHYLLLGPVGFGVVIQLVRVQTNNNECNRSPLIQDIVDAAVRCWCEQTGLVLQPTRDRKSAGLPGRLERQVIVDAEGCTPVSTMAHLVAVDEGFVRCAAGLGPLARPRDAAAEGLAVGTELRVLEVHLDRLLVDVRLDRGVLAVGMGQPLMQAEVFAALDFGAAATMNGHRVRAVRRLIDLRPPPGVRPRGVVVLDGAARTSNLSGRALKR